MRRLSCKGNYKTMLSGETDVFSVVKDDARDETASETTSTTETFIPKTEKVNQVQIICNSGSGSHTYFTEL